jgi:ABC-type transport system involved in multi-copper enzyme maturation permease subunit
MTDLPADERPITEPIRADAAAPSMSAQATGSEPATSAAEPSRRRQAIVFGRTAGGIAAIGVKELRGRMRGRRAFAIVTIYLLLLAGFALMVERLIERGYETSLGQSSAFASAAIGQGIFAALLLLMTLQVVFLAPSSTAGAISLEREKQTLDLLVATPITSLAIVLGKLLSALVYVFLLIAASLPLMAVVFVYGGVGPEDVLRGYAVLLVTALGLGSFGILCSSLVRRTTASTAITIFGVLALTIGTGFVLIFWTAMGVTDQNGNRGGLFGQRPPAVLAYVNPFLAQADVMCGTQTGLGGWCELVQTFAPSDQGVIFQGGGGGFPVEPAPLPMPMPAVPGKGVVGPGRALIEVPADAVIDRGVDVADIAPAQPFGVVRDSLWPKSIVTWLIISALSILISVQAVSPTRRWRLRRGRPAAPPTTPTPATEPAPISEPAPPTEPAPPASPTSTEPGA